MLSTDPQASPSSRFTAKRGDRFGSYVLVRQLGRGGMASVYEAEHGDLGKRVAVKIMHPTVAGESVAKTRFLREARAVAQLRHLHIVNVFDVGTEDGLPFMVMELLEGNHLGATVAQEGSLPLTVLVEIFLPVVSAVHEAHRNGVIHRDLKPANVFLSNRGFGRVHPVVVDFGISKTASGDDLAPLTQSESLLGTVPYMSPEQTKGARLADAKSDQYAIGVMLYECATGRRPFQGNSHYDLMHAIVTAGVQPPSRINAALPAEFDEMVLRAMNRDAEKRYPTLHALGSALMSFGNRTTSTLWAGEFLDIEKRTTRSQSDLDTLHDAAPTGDAVPPPKGSSAISAFPRRWSRFGLTAIVFYAGIVTWLLIERSHPSPLTELASLRAGALSVASGSPPLQRAATEAEPSWSVAAAEPIVEPRPSIQVEEPHPALAAPRRKREGHPSEAASGPSPAIKRETRRSESTATGAATRVAKPDDPALMLGTNSAPIVE